MPIITAVLRITLVALAAFGLVWATPRFADGAIGLARNNDVHYVGHLLAGRIFSLCPCTLRLAETHYVKGMYHARTPRQAALLTSQRPTSLRARIAEAPLLAAGVVRHLRGHLTA
jgi:hypothetical protein